MIIGRIVIVIGWLVVIAAVLSISRWPQPAASDRSITVFCWSDFFDREKLDEFEAQTGIQVMLNFYETNEELLAKLRMTGGHGYDIIIPTDFSVPLLINEGLIKKLDTTAIDCFSRLHPSLLGHYFDPMNEYSIPVHWSIYGLGINCHYFKKLSSGSWRLLFEPLEQYKVIMPEEARELILVAAQYLFGNNSILNNERLIAIEELLCRQRGWVEAYNDNRADYFIASGACPVAASLSSDMLRLARAIKHEGTVDFVVPQEGGFIIIDSVCLTSAGKKDALVYKFINYIFQDDIIIHHMRHFPFMPVTMVALQQLEEEALLPSFSPFNVLANLNTLAFFKSPLLLSEEHALWMRVRS